MLIIKKSLQRTNLVGFFGDIYILYFGQHINNKKFYFFQDRKIGVEKNISFEFRSVQSLSCAPPTYTPTRGGFLSSAPSPTFVICSLLNDGHSDHVRRSITVVLVCVGSSSFEAALSTEGSPTPRCQLQAGQ